MRPPHRIARVAVPSLLSLLLLELASTSQASASRSTPQIPFPAAPADTAPRTPVRTPLAFRPLDIEAQRWQRGDGKAIAFEFASPGSEVEEAEPVGPTPTPTASADDDDEEEDVDADDDDFEYEVVYDDEGNAFELVEEMIEVLEDENGNVIMPSETKENVAEVRDL